MQLRRITMFMRVLAILAVMLMSCATMLRAQDVCLQPRSALSADKDFRRAFVLKLLLEYVGHAKQEGLYPRQISIGLEDALRLHGFQTPVVCRTERTSGGKPSRDLYRFHMQKIPVTIFYEDVSRKLAFAIGHFRNQSEDMAFEDIQTMNETDLAKKFSENQIVSPTRPWVEKYHDLEIVNKIIPSRNIVVHREDYPSVGEFSLASELLVFRPLKKDEIVRLVAEIQNGNGAARQALVEHHGRYIVGQAKRYKFLLKDEDVFDKLVSDMVLAALRAAETFNPASGTFITYLTLPIGGVLKGAVLREKARDLGISSRLVEKISEFNALKERLGREPMPGEISRELGLSPQKAKQLSIAMSIATISYEEWMDKEAQKEETGSSLARAQEEDMGRAGDAAQRIRYLEDPDVTQMLNRMQADTGISTTRWATFLLYKGILHSRAMEGDANSEKVAQLFDVSGARSREVIKDMTVRLQEHGLLRDILHEALLHGEGFVPTIKLEDAREKIRAIFEQRDPTKQLVQDGLRVSSFRFKVFGARETFLTFDTTKGPKKLTSGSKMARGDVTVEVRYAPGIGYVFETDKVVEGDKHFSTAKTINSDGDYVALDAIPGYWVTEFRNSLEEKNNFVSELRWKTVMRILLRGKNLGRGIPLASGEPAGDLLEGFRFKVPNAAEEFFQMRVPGGPRKKLLSGSEGIGDLEVCVRFAPGIGYVLEMTKTLPGQIPVPTIRVIDDNGDFGRLKEIPEYWEEELRESLVSPRAGLSETKWKTIIDMMWAAKDTGQPLWIMRAGGAKSMLAGFHFLLAEVKAHFYSPVVSGEQKHMYSGSRDTGALGGLVTFQPHVGYVFDLIKIVGAETCIGHRAIQDGEDGRQFYVLPDHPMDADLSRVEASL